MTSDEYIAIAEQRYPELFAAEKIQLTPAALRTVIRHAFESGASAELQRLNQLHRDTMPDFVRGIFN